MRGVGDHHNAGDWCMGGMLLAASRPVVSCASLIHLVAQHFNHLRRELCGSTGVQCSKMLQPIVELCASVCYIAAFAVVAYGIFGDVEGGHLPMSMWFGWHPFLMALSFPCLMGLGRMGN
eukprot:505433-Amphidinium_carterae.1